MRGCALLMIFCLGSATGARPQVRREIAEFRRLNPQTAVCVNRPLNRTGRQAETETAGELLAQKIREAGFTSGVLGTVSTCGAVVYTEITSRTRRTTEVEFRVLMADEQIPRLCSSARGKSIALAFSDEAGQILKAQQKGMRLYVGALEPRE